MKNTVLLLTLFWVLLSGCNGNTDADGPAVAIEMNRDIMLLGSEQPVGKFTILKGNGDYRIVYPKRINVGGEEVRYSEALIKLTITDDRVVVAERLFFEDYVTGLFMITDAKNAKKLFHIGDTDLLGLVDMDEVESRMLNALDFWESDCE